MENTNDIEANIVIEKEIEIENKTELIQNMINNIFDQLNIADIDNGIDKKLNDKNISVIMTSTKNQKKNENEKIITMNLGECENILKTEYNISENDSLYILQIIAEEEGMKSPKMEYEVYYPFYNNINNLTKLNLNLCKGTKIEISIPVKIDDNLDKYNPKSGYYNDICYKTTSESGTDISLKDRRNEFTENNMTLREENCDLIDYNYTNEKVKCSCDIKTNINPNYDFKFNVKEFYKNFIDINNIANINIIKCYKIVLNIKNLLYNYGFYIMAFIMFLFFLTIFIFCCVSYKKIKKNLNYISIILNNNKSIEIQQTINRNKNLITKKNNKNQKKKTKNNMRGESKKNFNNSINKKYDSRNNINNGLKYRNNFIKSTKNNDSLNKLNKIKNIKFKSNDLKDLLEEKDFEINALKYELAIKLDKRNYFHYYASLIKYNHPLMFSFGCYNDYNSRIIKIFLFFFSFGSDLTINALFLMIIQCIKYIKIKENMIYYFEFHKYYILHLFQN